MHYRAFDATTGCSAPAPRFGTLDLVGAAWSSPLASERQVLTFLTRAWLSFAPPTCRMPLGQASGFSRADPGGRVPPVSTSPNPLATLHRRFACARLSRPCLPKSLSRRFRNAHHHGFCPQQRAGAKGLRCSALAIGQLETGGAGGRGKAVQDATAEHRAPCDSRGSCTVLGAPGGAIPPGDSTTAAIRPVSGASTSPH